MKEKILKIIFIILNITMVIPSIVYLTNNKTVMGFNTYYNFFINPQFNKTISTILYLIILLLIFTFYIIIIKKKIFKNIKEILIYVLIISAIYLIMLPWTSSDIFYYMGVGQLDGKYNQNPYYITMEEYYEANSENINDDILEQGKNSCWANTTVVYGPTAQLIFKICTLVSFKNINICLLIFKIVNLIVHISNCYLIYKITNKKIFSLIYGLNPFILIEFIGNVHNDIIVVFFTLLALYFITKKKNINISIIALAIATGIKYYTILLLPIIILYHFKKEKIGKRILKCVQYGLMFFILFILQYIMYFQDTTIFTAMLPQGSRYSKSIYSVMCFINPFSIMIFRTIFIILFIYFAICFYIQFLVQKENKIADMLKKYNTILILFLLTLTNCQQWYLLWLFTTIMWQKNNMIKNIIGLSFITQIANTVYMFNAEKWIYDIHYILIIMILFMVYTLIFNKKKVTT